MPQDLIPVIKNALLRDPAYCELAQAFLRGAKTPKNVFGLAQTAKAPLGLSLFAEVAASQEGQPPSLLWIVPDVLRARTLAEEISALRGRPCPVLHAKPSDLVAAGHKSRKEEIERLSILTAFLNREEDLLLISAPFLLDKLPAPQSIRQREIHLQVGEDYSRGKLISQLTELGYVRAREIDSPAQFAVRGEILDIGLYGSQLGQDEEYLGLRLNFFDEELEALKIFDLKSQRSVEEISSFVLPPMRNTHLSVERRQELADSMRKLQKNAIAEARRNSVEPAAITQLERWTSQDIENMESGQDFAGLARWSFLLSEENYSILDYAVALSATLIIEEPKLLRSRLDASEAEFREELTSLILKQNILPQIAESRTSPAEAFRALDQYAERKLVFSNLDSSGNGLPGGEKFQIQTNLPDKYHGREEYLLEDLRDWQKGGWESVLAVPGERQEKRLRELLLEESLTLPIRILNLNEGVIFPASQLVILGTENIFGRRQSVRRRKRQDGAPIDFFGDLSPGDLVVHDVHGIGKYLGLKTLNTSGSERDYLHIAYAGEDSLYIPVDQLGEIQRYIGTESSSTRLSKLGSKEWERKKARARESVRKVAIDLLAMYTQREKQQGYAFSPDTVWQKEFEDRFPFVETEDQVQAMAEIKADMESSKIMDRLLCGDVGFGKTELAFRAMFKSVMDGKQAALIVPTTVLAGQHYHSFLERLGETALRVKMLSRFVSAAERRKIMHEVAQGSVDVLIGTHSILNKDLKFKDLGLLVIDEEQRFGVEQKELLKERYPRVDVLSLSATPIPRTLHMAISNVRDISLLQEGPEARRAVQTYVMEYEPPVIDDAILREISREGQVFYIFNNISKLSAKHAELQERLPGARIRRAHGRMSERQIEDTISDFLAGEFDILLCTTIVESGIDMPKVNTLIVEHAERMGLAQLYQLRGRVGRSEKQAYAYITYPPDSILKEDASKRLAAIRDFTELGSGLRIAMRDLEVRGAGNFLGGEQSGHMGAVGYDLYTRMLEESIKELQGEAPLAASASCFIDLDLDAHIPASYIADDGQRMDIYRRILEIGNIEDWSEVLDELLDRFGDLPRSVINLVDIALVRAVATQLGFSQISRRREDIILSLQEGEDVDMEKIFQLFQNERVARRLHFNAGQHAHLIYRGAAAKPDHMAEELRHLFSVKFAH